MPNKVVVIAHGEISSDGESLSPNGRHSMVLEAKRMRESLVESRQTVAIFSSSREYCRQSAMEIAYYTRVDNCYYDTEFLDGDSDENLAAIIELIKSSGYSVIVLVVSQKLLMAITTAIATCLMGDRVRSGVMNLEASTVTTNYDEHPGS